MAQVRTILDRLAVTLANSDGFTITVHTVNPSVSYFNVGLVAVYDDGISIMDKQGNVEFETLVESQNIVSVVIEE